MGRVSAPVRRLPAAWSLRLALLLSWLVAPPIVAAQSLAFTVQVIAVSDQANALDISRGLLRDGFPAYVVRSTGGQGDVYRVRVGAFGNRVAAARYAAAMPSVGGARPVPALAEAIPAGIMPLTPRVVWHAPAAGTELRVLPWPNGIALRRQSTDPLLQATYSLIQGAEVRTVEAWRVAPLAEMPPAIDIFDVPFIDLTGAAGDPPDDVDVPFVDLTAAATDRPDDIDVPFVDLTVAGDGAAAEAADEGTDPPDAEPAAPEGASGADGDTAMVVPAIDAAAEPVASEGDRAAATSSEGAQVETDAPDALALPPVVASEPVGDAAAAFEPAWAEPSYGAAPEVGLVLLRDRSLWPVTWAEDGPEVRAAFRSATLALVANRIDLSQEFVERHGYLPGGGPPPALIVVEVSDRSGRDLGDIRSLGDPVAELRPEGPPPAAGLGNAWWPIGGIGQRVALSGAPDEPVVGEGWILTRDMDFVRITTEDGSSWRAVSGAPLWSDGRYALVLDGEDVLLVDFLPR